MQMTFFDIVIEKNNFLYQKTSIKIQIARIILIYLTICDWLSNVLEESTMSRKAFLEYILELREKGDVLTDEEIFDELNTFMAAVSLILS